LPVLVGHGDLVVFVADEPGSTFSGHSDRALRSLLNAGISGVVTNVEPTPALRAVAEYSATPFISTDAHPSGESITDSFDRQLLVDTQKLIAKRLELERDFDDLAGWGATRARVVEVLAETTGKTGLLQVRDAPLEILRTPFRQSLNPLSLRAAINSSDGAAHAWMRDIADSAVDNVLHLELPTQSLVRLVAPVWVDGLPSAALSLFGRAFELTTGDRISLTAAAGAIATISDESGSSAPVENTAEGPNSVAAIAVRSDAQLELTSNVIRERFHLIPGAVAIGRDAVRLLHRYQSPDHFNQEIRDWPTALESALGTVSIGYALRHISSSDQAEVAILDASEALATGDRLYGPGHVTSFSDALIARHELGGRESAELRTLFERVLGKLAAEDPRRDNGLMTTLETYCETFSTHRTAERLRVHRNTVQNRVKRIEEITAADLEDGSTRLLFQLAFRADRLLEFVVPGVYGDRGYIPRQPANHEILSVVVLPPGRTA
jgi:hypothetical protein